MERCVLCPNESREAALSFHHVRRGERVDLEVPLCEDCGVRIEKHLKRAIPKRLVRISPLLHLVAPSGTAAVRKAA